MRLEREGHPTESGAHGEGYPTLRGCATRGLLPTLAA